MINQNIYCALLIPLDAFNLTLTRRELAKLMQKLLIPCCIEDKKENRKFDVPQAHIF